MLYQLSYVHHLFFERDLVNMNEMMTVITEPNEVLHPVIHPVFIDVVDAEYPIILSFAKVTARGNIMLLHDIAILNMRPSFPVRMFSSRE